MEQALNLDLNRKNIYEHPIEYFFNENKLYKTQITTLTSEINFFREENFSLNQKILAKEGELRISKSSQEQTAKMFSELSRRLISSQNENNELRKELLKSVEEQNSILNQKNSINREKEILNLELKDAQQEILNKLKEIQNYREQIEQITTEKLNLSDDLLTIKNQLAQEKFSSGRIQNELNGIRNEFLSKEKSFTIEKQNYNLSITNMNEIIKDFRENIITITRKSEENIYKINLQKDDIKNQCDRMSLKIQENEMNLELKSKKIEELGNIIIELKRHIRQSASEAKILTEIINDKEKEISKLEKIKSKYDSYISIEKTLDRVDQELFFSNAAAFKEEWKKLCAINSKLQKDSSLVKEFNEKYKIELNELREIKSEFDNIYKEHESTLNQNNNLIELLEKSEKFEKEKKNELDILNQFVEKLSKQNRELLYEIRLNQPSNNFLSQNLTKERYEEFIYTNINDIEPRFSDLIKKNISLKKELQSYKELIPNYESGLKEKEEIIKNFEDCVRNLEETNKKIKKEYETFKFYSESHYHLFTLNFSADEHSYFAKLEEMKENLQQMNINYQSLSAENYKNLEVIDRSQKNFEELNLKNLELKNSNYNKDIELNRYKMEIANYFEMRKNHLNLIEVKENEINILKSELASLKMLNERNLKEKEDFIQNLGVSLNDTNKKLYESSNYFKIQIEKLFQENSKLKNIYEEFTKSFITLGVISENKNLIQSGEKFPYQSDLSTEELSKSLQTFKAKLISREEEKMKLKESKSELEIKIENILSENSSLKYKNEFLTKRIKFFKNLLSENKSVNEKKSSSSLLNFKKKPVHKERVLKVTEISMNEPERREYSININEKIENDYQLINEEEMEVEAENVENLEARINYDDTLAQKYIETLSLIETLKSQHLLLENKNREINEINFNLVQNDLNAPYAYLFKKIEDLSNRNVTLESDIKFLQEEKLKFINDYVFINLQSEQIKRNEENLKNYNKEMSHKICCLEAAVQEHMTKSAMYEQSKNTLREKDALINSLYELKDDVERKISSLDLILSEKNKMIENLEAQVLSAEENKEKHVKNQIELQNKELTQSKSNIFKNFYVCFKRSKYLIETFSKLKEILEEKIENLEKANRKSETTRDFKEFNNVLCLNEQQISDLKKKLKDSEWNNSELVKSLNSEIEGLKGKEKSLVNEIKTFKNLHQFEGSLDLKNYFGKLLRNMHSSTNIINFQAEKIKDLESQIGKLKEDMISVRSLEDRTGSNVLCEKCKILLMEVKVLCDNNKELSRKLSEESYLREENEKGLNKCKIEKEFLLNDVQKISEFIKEEYEKLPSRREVSSIPQWQTEKNKTFSNLINQMRKASKIITLLEKNTKELSEEGLRLLRKDK